MGRLKNEFGSTNLDKDTKDLFKGLSDPNVREEGGEIIDPTLGALVQAVQEDAAKKGIEAEVDITTEQVRRTTQQDVADMDEPQLRLMALMNQFFPEEEGIPAIERLSRKELFPTLDQPIEVGFVGGKVIGRQPIFAAPPAVFPSSIVHARRRALEDAAKKKVAAKKKIFDSAFVKSPEQLQRQMDSISTNFIEKWSRITNNKLELLLDTDNPIARQFHKELRGLQTVGAELLDLDKLADEIVTASTDVKNSVPKSAMKEAGEFQEGVLNLPDFVNKPEKYGKIRNRLKSYNNMVHLVRSEIMPGLTADIDRAIENMSLKEIDLLKSTGDANIWRSTLVKHLGKDRARILATNLKNSVPNLQESVEDIEQHILAKVGTQLKESNILERKWHDFRQPEKTNEVPWTSGGSITLTNFKTGKVMELETIKHTDLSGVKNSPKSINIKPTTIMNILNGTKGKTVDAFKVDVVGVFTDYINPKTGRIAFQKGTEGGLPTAKVVKDNKLKEETFVTLINREERPIEYESGTEIFEIPVGGTFTILYDEIKQPLKNSGFEILEDKIIIKGQEVGFSIDDIKDFTIQNLTE